MSDPNSETPYGPREAVAEWLAANGIDPNDVPLHSAIVIERDPLEGRSIRHTAMLRNAAGLLEHDWRTDAPKAEQRTTPLKAEPPAEVQIPEEPAHAH